MSPKIWVGENLVADVIDQTGWHQTLDEKPLYVNVDLIDASKQQQRIILESERIGGIRIIGLNQEGRGNSKSRRGDKKHPPIRVELQERPIRVTYSPVIGIETPDVYSMLWGGLEPTPIRGPRETLMNPRWVRSKERG